MRETSVQKWLKRQHSALFSLYAIAAAFSTYACMYVYRRSYTAAGYEGYDIYGIELKTALIISQVIGYMLSKFIGIKVVSEMATNRRSRSIVILILTAHTSLLLFWLVPLPYSILFLFLNGLPLGMIWGLVFSYLEGRRNTELLGAGLSVSFIVASGMSRSAGTYVMENWGVSEFAMPFVTGLLFLLPLLFFVWMLNQVPPPGEKDVQMRVKRVPMSKHERWSFFYQYAAGIVVLTFTYMGLTAYRDLRDNYAFEILSEIGYSGDAAIFTQTEIPIAIVVLIVMALLMLIRENKKALMVNHYIIAFGFLLIGSSTLLFQQNIINGFWWMVLVGMGSYLGYVPFNCILFDRFIATFRTMANAGFLIYIADSFGYLSSVGVLLYKNLSQSEVSWFQFFLNFSYFVCFSGLILTFISYLYFRQKRMPVNITSTIPKTATAA
ncbi:MAG: hypothetical protein GVY02_01410 [Bacteroidetes bacterium]|jgi:MFS family permease|nr:hypothetical protein [Bacteroidota bacterium]